MLSGMNAATSRNVISATMQHLLVSNGGTRFKFSHGFGNLLVGQLEASLEGWPIDIRVRSNILNGDNMVWQDSASDDYIHRPDNKEFRNMCAYEMTMHFKKTCKTFKEMKNIISRASSVDSDNDKEDFDYDSISESERFNGQGYERKKYAFSKSHPGRYFCHLARLKRWVVPKVFIPKEKLCKIEELKIKDGDEVDEETKDLLEHYAKFALLMFYPYRKLGDLKKCGSYWKCFSGELTRYKRDKRTKFWTKGFEIMQNIQDRMTLDTNMKRATDFIINVTTCRAPEETETKEPNTNNNMDIDDILNFCKSTR